MRTLEFSEFCFHCSFNRIHSSSMVRRRILGNLLFWGFDTLEVLIVFNGRPLRQGSLQVWVMNWSFYLFGLPWGISFIDALCIWILFRDPLIYKILSRLLYSQSNSVVWRLIYRLRRWIKQIGLVDEGSRVGGETSARPWRVIDFLVIGQPHRQLIDSDLFLLKLMLVHLQLFFQCLDLMVLFFKS